MFTKITETDLANKGVTGLPDTPNLSTMEMQAKFDEIGKDVIVPKFNNLVDELDEKDLDKVTHSEDITDFKLDSDGRMQVSTDGGETYGYAGSTGHQIMDGSGTRYPARANLQFSQNVSITDYDEQNGNKTFLSVVGEKGDRGDGATIRVGTVESADTPSVENVGSLTDAIFNFKFPKGDDGDSATVAIGSVTKGENASVYNSGTSSNAVFNFVLPKGDKGDTGQGINILGEYATLADLQLAHPTGQRGDSYMVGTDNPKDLYIWDVDNNQWANQGALQGAKGDTGSAATVTIGSVSEGSTMGVENVGTSTDAILNFTLKKGDKGDQGNTGTIAVGNVTSGENASVTNVGTSTQAVFDFVIPRGEKGDQGSPTVINGKSGANVTLYGSDIYVSNEDGAYTVSQEISNLHTEIAENGGGSVIRVTFDEEQSGHTITFAIEGMDTVSKVVPSVEPHVIEISTREMGVMTITDTNLEKSMELTIDTYELYSFAFSSASFDYQEWLDAGEVSGTYASLEEVLADEKALRQLFTKHASVDYLVECCSSELDENVETIVQTDLCAKWINLRDYALDTLYANTYIASAMDEADKYFYGEWALKGGIPQITSASSDIICSWNDGRAPWYAFDGDSNSYTHPNQGATSSYIGYDFKTPITVGSVSYVWNKIGSPSTNVTFTVQGSNDNSVWENVSESHTFNVNTSETFAFNNSKKFRYYCLNITSTLFPTSGNVWAIYTLQFNVWQPKGNVPIMTSNTTPSGEVSASSVYSGYQHYAWKAFDNDNNTMWQAQGTTNATLTYKFANPVCAKAFYMIPNEPTRDTSCRVKNFDISGSNNGTDWTPLYTGVYTPKPIAEIKKININNSNNYLYYKLHVTDTYGFDISVMTLQYYGRELKVSVPKMSGNTSPWGEASDYRVFDGNASTSVSATDFSYNFKNSVCAKYFTSSANGGTLQGSNDGSVWTDISTPSSNTVAYSRLRVHYASSTSVHTVQFYGLDYSEHEERHWIYDHGVEVEEVTSDGYLNEDDKVSRTCVKNSEYVEVTALNTEIGMIGTKNGIDLSNYTLLRGIIGSTTNYANMQIGVCSNKKWDSLSYSALTDIKANGDFTEYNKFSSLQQVAYPCVRCYGQNVTQNLRIVELWLE